VQAIVLASVADKNGRKYEQREDIKWALESILARVERGMTVEIRLIPPTPTAAHEGEAPSVPKEFQELQELVPKLTFPRIEGAPVLRLPPSEPTKESKPE
jgi:hypothetical protein